MAKAAIWDYSTTNASNTDIDGTDSTGTTGLVKSGDNYTRSIMAHAKGFALDLGSVNTVGGTADATTVTLAAAPSALVDGMRFTFNAVGANTTNMTLNVTPAGGSAFGAKKVMKWSAGSEAELSANDIPAANALIEVIYDSARNTAAGAWMLLGSSVTFATNAQALAASSTTLAINPANLASLIQNINNNAFKIADLEGVRLNMAGGIADAYDSETDVDTTTSTNESYDAANDLYSPTDSTSTTGTWGDTPVGSRTIGSGSGGAHNGGFQFTAPATSTVTAVRVNIVSASASGTWEMRLYTNSGGSPGTQVGTASASQVISTTGEKTFTFNTPPSITSGNVYWIVMANTAGAPDTGFATVANNASYGSGRDTTITSITTTGLPSSEDWRLEITYSTTGKNNMTLVSNAFTATAVPTQARVAVFIDPQESITINTDFTAEASRDGGTTWTAVTLASVSNPVGTVEQYEGTVSISAQPSGSSMNYRLKTLNNKDIDVTGIVFQWA